MEFLKINYGLFSVNTDRLMHGPGARAIGPGARVRDRVRESVVSCASTLKFY